MIAYGAINFTGGIALLAALNIVEIFVHEAEVIQLVAIFSRLIGGILLALSVPAIIAGIGYIQEKAWAKTLGLGVGIVYLLLFPIGTIIGIYSIWLNAQEVIKEKEPIYAEDLVKGAVT